MLQKQYSEEQLISEVDKLLSANDPTKAYLLAKQAWKTNPNSPVLTQQYIRMLLVFKRYADTAPLFSTLKEASPSSCDLTFFIQYQLALQAAGRFAEAWKLLEEMLTKFPNEPEIYLARGYLRQIQSDFSAMLADYEKAAALRPIDPELQYRLAQSRLMISGFTEGFDAYAKRRVVYTNRQLPLSFAIPLWQGAPLEGKKLLLVGEQGVGDITMFSTLLPHLLAKGPEVTCVLFEPKLGPLLRRAFPGMRVEVLDGAISSALEQAHDCYFPMGHLLLLAREYRPSEHPPALKADEEKARSLRENYLAGEKRRLVGISWFTGNSRSSAIRNIPLEQWAPLLEVPGVQFISLQYKPDPKELAAIEAQYPGKLLVDGTVNAFHDLDGLAAQILAMDEVITIQNATAHLSGALGQKTTLLLSAASDWRWGVETETSYWYPDVSIKRQKKILEWGEVMEQIKCSLQL